MIKYLFPAINLFLLTFAAYFTVQAAYHKMGTEVVAVEQEKVQPAATQKPEQKKKIKKDFRQQYGLIAKRNLFNVQAVPSINKEKTLPQRVVGVTKKVKKTKLKMVLKGIAMGDTGLFAVIIAPKSKKQELYTIGDPIHGQEAVITGIFKDHVTFIHKGVEQELRMKIPESHFSGTDPETSDPDEQPVRKPGSLTAKPPGAKKNLGAADALKRWIRTKSRQVGDQDGLLLYGIRPNSVFKKMGLQNGDILTRINNNPADSEAALFDSVQSLGGGDTLELTIMRRGKERKVVYQQSGRPDE